MLRRCLLASMSERPIFAAIQTKLTAALQPVELEIVDESSKHAGHKGNPSGDPSAETHFRLTIVSAKFEGKQLVQRHRMVYDALREELQEGGVHALAMKTRTPAEAME